MAMYKRPNVSRIASLSTAAARQAQGLRGGPRSSNSRVQVLSGGLGYEANVPVTSFEYANPTGEATVTQTATGGYEYNQGYSSGGSGAATSIFSAIGNIFGSKSSTTGYSYMPTTSNTSTYLLIGGAVLGGILLVTLLR